MIILDTNVLSETIRRATAPEVLPWLAAQPPSRVFTTAVSMAEILYGIEVLPGGKRRAALQAKVREMFAEDFAGRVLAFDSEAAGYCAALMAARRAKGRPIGQFDAQIAAIARSQGAALATRDAGGFADCGVTLVDRGRAHRHPNCRWRFSARLNFSCHVNSAPLP
jgi:predicted nucleic acid-binding protein